ncbi:transposase [Desulfovibrio sp. TomC]|uniref:transposase n=1 Tax=Desulfovibrio sp. TomC TaxID=1562888 RepID=UPI0009E2037B
MESESEKLCAEAGYTGEALRNGILAAGYEPPVRSRSEEQRKKVENASYNPCRWVVEAGHSWFHRFRKLTRRYEKLGATQ